jgi:hypothetical protein
MTAICQDTNSVPSTDQFAMQDVRIAEYLIRNDGEPVDGTGWLPVIHPRLTLTTESAVDTSNNPEITPQEHVVVLHQNVRSRLHMLFLILHLNKF